MARAMVTMVGRGTAITAAMRPVITAAATLPPTTAVIDRVTTLPPIMVPGIGVHMHTMVDLGTTADIVTVGNRRDFCFWQIWDMLIAADEVHRRVPRSIAGSRERTRLPLHNVTATV